jgi:hypothetical protein
MLRAPVNQSNVASIATGKNQNALSASNHGGCLLNMSGHGSNGLNVSLHSCCSCSSTTKGGNNSNYADVSLSNIFADEEEQMDIFGENSMVGFITALQMEQNGTSERPKTPGCQYHPKSFEGQHSQKKISPMKSMRTIGTDSTSTWQGSCNSFLGMDDELLDLSFTVNDFDKGNDDLSLHTKNTTASDSSPTKTVPRTLSRKDIDLNSCKKERTSSTTKRTLKLKPNRSSTLVVTGGGMHHCFSEESGKSSADQSPRKPVRRCEEEETEQPDDNVAAGGRQKLRDAVEILSNVLEVPTMQLDEESTSSEVIKINVGPVSRNSRADEISNHTDCSSTFQSCKDLPSQSLPCSMSLSQSYSEVSSKEDSAPKCPRRGTSPARSIAGARDHPCEAEPAVSKRTDCASFNQRGAELGTTECKTPPSPRKKVMMIAIKDLEKYVSDVSETDGKIQKAAISTSRYKKIMKAAEEKQLNCINENERVKISTSTAAGTSPYSTRLSIPESIAVDCSDRSLSSMDDSGRPFLHDNRSPPPGIVTAKLRKNNLFKAKSTRSLVKSPSSCNRISTTTNARTNPKMLNQKPSVSPKTRRIIRAASCLAITDSTTTSTVNPKKTSSCNRGKNVSGRKFMRSSSCLLGKSNSNDSFSPTCVSEESADTSPELKIETTVQQTRFVNKLRRVSSCCDIVNPNLIRNGDPNQKNIVEVVPKTRQYDSPIIRPTTFLTSMSEIPTTSTIDVSSPQRQPPRLAKSIVIIGDDGKQYHHHHHRDKPPTSPRRYITPTRGSSFRCRSN